MDSLSVIIVVLAAAALVAIAVLYLYLFQPHGGRTDAAPRREQHPHRAAAAFQSKEFQPVRHSSVPRGLDDIASGLDELRRDVSKVLDKQRAIEKMLESLVDQSGQSTGHADARDAVGHRAPRDFRFQLQRRSAGEKAPVPPESRAARAKEIVTAYCQGEMSLDDLIVEANRSDLVWGSVNINKQQFESQRPGDIMAFGAEATGEAFVVVSGDCRYNQMGMAFFFNRVDARDDQRVFATTPAKVVLSLDGTVEPRTNGVLEARVEARR